MIMKFNYLEDPNEKSLLDKKRRKEYTEPRGMQTRKAAFENDAVADAALGYLYADANKSKTQGFLKGYGFPSVQDRALNKQLYGASEEQTQMRDMLKSTANSILNAKLPTETDRAFLHGLMGEKDGEDDYQKQITTASRAKDDLLSAFRDTQFEREVKPSVPTIDSPKKLDIAQQPGKSLPFPGFQNKGNGKGFWYIPGTENLNPPSPSTKPSLPSSPTIPSKPALPNNSTPPNNPNPANSSEATNSSGDMAKEIGSEKVLLRYAVEQAGGTVTWDEKTGTAIVNIDGDTKAYKCDIINGRMVIDADTLANDFGKDTLEFQTNTETTFNSEQDAALAFGLRYRKYSDENKIEYGAIIVSKEENGKKVYSYKNIVKSKPLLSKEDLTGASETEILDAEDDFSRRGVDYDWTIGPKEQIEATIHTHWHPDGKLDFSKDDYLNQASEVKGMYVVLRTSEFLYSKRTATGFSEKIHIF